MKDLIEKEGGAFGQTYLLRNSPGLLLKVFDPFVDDKEAITTCVASSLGVSPLFKGAWKDPKGQVNILLQDYELGKFAQKVS